MFAISPKMILIDGTLLGSFSYVCHCNNRNDRYQRQLYRIPVRPIKKWWRLFLFASGFMLVIPGIATDIAGSLQIALVIILHRFFFSKEKMTST